MKIFERAVEADSILVRASYFEWKGTFPTENGPRVTPAPTLRDIERALAQLGLFFNYAARITPHISEGSGELLRSQKTTRIRYAGHLGREPRLVSLHMGSPLHVVFEVEQYLVASGGLVLLAERIATFGPRVSAKRKKALLEAAKYDAAHQQVVNAQADVLGDLLLEGGPSRPGPRGPDRLDFVDPQNPDGRLTPLQP
jgi:hypothetical protein